ncbi:MAG: hypothetical protein AB9842_09855 [Bacteroidales bacterium]
MAGSSGISILVHDCSGSKKTNYVAFPALHDTKPGSCCGKSCNLSEDTQQTVNSIKKAKCCKSSKITLKVNPYERQYTTQASVLISPELPVTGNLTESFEADDTLILACNSPPQNKGFKPSGKELVFIINQLRIPFSC